MDNKKKTYLQEFFPLWRDGFRLWIGGGTWGQFVTSLVFTIGAPFLYLYFNEVVIAIENLRELAVAVFIGLFWYIFIAVITYIGANIKLYDKQKQLIQKKAGDINKLEDILQSKTLNLMVEPGNDIVVDVGGGVPNVTLKLDVINKELKKIVEMEAYLTRVDQITEELPEDWSFTNSITSFRTQKLEWKNKKYLVDLTPGFPESFIKIVSLDCSIPKVTFINDGYPVTIPVLQKDALYNIKVHFKGKLEGETNYRFFDYETVFACAPRNSQIDFLLRGKDNPNMPDWLRERMNLMLNKKENEQ